MPVVADLLPEKITDFAEIRRAFRMAPESFLIGGWPNRFRFLNTE
jgi:hypothetical protein